AMEVDAQLRTERPDRTELWRQNLIHIRIALEDFAEPVLNYHRHLQIGPATLQNLQRGRGQHAIAQRPQSHDRDAAPARELLQDASHYSSTLASSTSMTGISSRMGYTRWHSTHFKPLPSGFNSTVALSTGQTRISNRSLLIAIATPQCNKVGVG